ncbi:MAG: Transcription initiation factor IIB [Promethearchaeota archaeon]|nr:MAG: Transcription initiation factor IIB [Candidatus Lokiarchaeota archaeon]
MSERSFLKERLRKKNLCETDTDWGENECCENPCIERRDGDSVCINCGMVYGKNIVKNERRAYTAQEVESRRQTEPRWRGFGPRTILPNDNVDSKGNKLNVKDKTLFSRLSKIQQSLISSIERNFWEAKPKLKMLISKLNIPEYIEETAWRIYTEVAKRKLTMGRSIDGFIGASLYAAIRIHEFPRLLEEVSDASMTSRHTIIRSLGMIIKQILPDLNLKYRPITSEQLIFRFGNDLGLPLNTQKHALDLLRNSSTGGLNRIGKDPKGFAASVLYMAAKKTNERKTQAEVSEVAGITEVTLRSRVKDIKTGLKRAATH